MQSSNFWGYVLVVMIILSFCQTSNEINRMPSIFQIASHNGLELLGLSAFPFMAGFLLYHFLNEKNRKKVEEWIGKDGVSTMILMLFLSPVALCWIPTWLNSAGGYVVAQNNMFFPKEEFNAMSKKDQQKYYELVKEGERASTRQLIIVDTHLELGPAPDQNDQKQYEQYQKDRAQLLRELDREGLELWQRIETHALPADEQAKWQRLFDDADRKQARQRDDDY